MFPVLKAEPSRSRARPERWPAADAGAGAGLRRAAESVAVRRALDRSRAGAAPVILEFLKRWARLGTAIVIVEQHIRIALPVADRVLLMERGEITWNSTATEFEGNFGLI